MNKDKDHPTPTEQHGYNQPTATGGERPDSQQNQPTTANETNRSQ